MKPAGESFRPQFRSGPAETPFPGFEDLSPGGPDRDRALLHCLVGMAQGLHEDGLREEVLRFLTESVLAMGRETMEGPPNPRDFQK